MNSKDLEQHMMDMFAESFQGHLKAINLDYSRYLAIIQQHMITLYGKHGDWNIALAKYKSNIENQNTGRIVQSVDEIPEIGQLEIMTMIAEEEEYKNLSREFLCLNDELKKEPENGYELCRYNEKLIRAAKIAGLFPRFEGASLNQYILDNGFMSSESPKVIADYLIAKGLLKLIINMLSYEYESGAQRNYPGANLVMQQQKTKYYYRGENAYYGKSQPSAYRHRRPNIPIRITAAIEDLRVCEAANFFIDFDTVRHWNLSMPNYMALGQHYGLWTLMMDITSDLKAALFFACCTYRDGNWYPLEENDFRNKDSRKDVCSLGGDSRYAILYQTPTEITTMEFGTKKDPNPFEIITPIGYQPFMRCAAQSAYIFACINPAYDMFKDYMYKKMKKRLTKELCNWIYEEMDKGEKIYPRNDVPNISAVMNKINSTHHFSECAFNDFCKNFSDDYAIQLQSELKQFGYHIV